jgi:Pvc16 N-terminal domain
MSNELAISGVTAVLEYILHNVFSGLTGLFGGTVTVSSLAPDLVQTNFTSGGTSSYQNQVNIFLHQVTYNQGWRNEGFPSLASDGKTPLQNPTLALDLHYLLTAYGQFDWQAEALLGYALLQLHQFPVIARADVSFALQHLSPGSLPNLAAALKLCGLADQIEMIKITPEKLGREEMAWLWTALKADYRPTFPFQVSVVLMQPPSNVSIALPVMLRQIQALPITPAQIISVQPPNKQPAALPGDSVIVMGEFLSGAGQVSLVNQRLGVLETVVLTALQVTNTTITFPVPNDPANFPAGIYSLSAQFFDSTGNVAQTTNSIPLAVAPAINLPSVTVVNSTAQTVITLTCMPSVRPEQSVYLAIQGVATAAQTFDATTNSLTFQFAPALRTGTQLAVLQVDEVASLVKWQSSPPAFIDPLVTI